MNRRYPSTDVPDMSPTFRRGTVTSQIREGLYQVNIFNGSILAILSGGRAEPAIDDNVDVEHNPVTNQWRIN